MNSRELNDHKSLALAHINIRSLQKNFDDMHDFITAWTKAPDIVCVSETRLKHEPLINVSLPGYNFEHVDSKSKAGGVAIYISTKFRYEINQNIDTVCLPDSESLWVTIFPSPQSQLTIAAIYRHPTHNVRQFTEGICSILTLLNSQNKTYYLLGDMNVNVAPGQLPSSSSGYINDLISCGAYSIITVPTRVTTTSSTIIDHIITNDNKHLVNPGVIRTDLTDHYVICCSVAAHIRRHNNDSFYMRRDKTNFNTDAYCDDLKNSLNELMLNQSLPNPENFDTCFDDFVSAIKETIDNHAPLKRLSRKEQKLKSKPWLTKGILVSIKCKRRLFKSHFSRGDDLQKAYYKAYSNKLTKIKTLSKKTYFEKELQNNSSNPRKFWEILRSALPEQSNKSSSIPTDLTVDGTKIDNPLTISECFNNFFCNIGENLAKNFQKYDKTNFKKFLRNRNPASLYLEPARVNEVINLINSINVNKSVGHDNIPPYFLRIASFIIAPVLCYYINNAFQYGIFPSTCKIAKVVPIFKSGKKDQVTNYRPISILTCFSKIFEKLICTRIVSFFNKHSVIHPNQYGFQKQLSTSHAVIDVVSKCHDQMNDGNYTGLVLLDFQKAFDTVSHDILVQKLDHYGIRGTPNQLLASFLADRKQYISLLNDKSQMGHISYGVPQGSNLGPLLFLTYINDLPFAIDCDAKLFADDTCLISSANNPTRLESKLNYNLKLVHDWTLANRITINPKKSSAIIIPPKERLVTPNLNIQIDSSAIAVQDSVKYLGIRIDNKLNFNNHIHFLEAKISKSVGILAKLKHVLPKKALTTLYFTMVHPHLLYGISIWGGTFKTYQNKLNTLQNKAVKIVTGANYYDHATPSYIDLNLLKLPDLYQHEIAKLMFRQTNNNFPLTFSNFFIKTTEVHYKTTRLALNKTSLRIPRYKTAKLQRSFKYQGVKIWNSIPESHKKLSFSKFKKCYKQDLISLYDKT